MDMESGAAVTSSALVTCFWWSSLTEPGQDCPKYRQRSHQLVCTNTDVSSFLHIGGKTCVGGARDEYERDYRHIYGVKHNFQNTETLGLIGPPYKSWYIKRMITCPLGWRALYSLQIYNDFLRAALLIFFAPSPQTSCVRHCPPCWQNDQNPSPFEPAIPLHPPNRSLLGGPLSGPQINMPSYSDTDL